MNHHTNHHTFRDQTIHNTLMQKLDDEQLEGSGFVLNGIVNVILETHKTTHNKMIFKHLYTMNCQKNLRIINQL